MELEEKAEEVLEKLWIGAEEAGKKSLSLAELEDVGLPAIDQLIREGYVASSDGQVRLTDKGRAEGRSVVRRHRLAERLLIDVLHTGEALMDERACKFEHLLDPDLEENICSLLGHPRACPHGKLIPPGRCCSGGRRQPRQVVSPLSRMEPGQTGKIAYVYAPKSGQLQKLMSMGIVPGTPISLIQSFPSYVFQIRQTQFAVDRDIAETVYVRLTEASPSGEGREAKQHVWQRFRRRLRAGKKNTQD